MTDDDVLTALASQVPSNPTGASAIDALVGLGYYGQVEAALARLVAVGKLRETSPGNYLPTSQEAQQ